MRVRLLRLAVVLAIAARVSGVGAAEQLKVRLSWGHRMPAAASHFVKAVPHDLEIVEVELIPPTIDTPK